MQIPLCLKAKSLTPAFRARKGGTVTPPRLSNPETSASQPALAWMLQVNTKGNGTPEQRGNRTQAYDSQLRKGSWVEVCCQTPPAKTEHVSCPSVQAPTTLASDTPRRLKTWWAELADVWVLDCPLLGRNRRTGVKSRTPLWLLWRTISLHFRMKCGRVQVLFLCTHQCETCSAY